MTLPKKPITFSISRHEALKYERDLVPVKEKKKDLVTLVNERFKDNPTKPVFIEGEYEVFLKNEYTTQLRPISFLFNLPVGINERDIIQFIMSKIPEIGRAHV